MSGRALSPVLICLFVKIKIVFSRTCAGKRHPESRERGDENEVHGEKTVAYMEGIRAA